MSEEMMVRYCAPTLAGIKTGAIFGCSYSTGQELLRWLRDMNRRLSNKGLRIVPLKMEAGRALIYVYRPAKLCEDMKRDEAAELLSRYGYSHGMPLRCVGELSRRMKDGEDFPHEIGLFLGYPPEDVRGFIEEGPSASKLSGAWKVYGDAEAAKKAFSLYKKCTGAYMRQYEKGCTIERLTVAV